MTEEAHVGQPGMRITVDAAMRARDVSAPRPDGDGPPSPAPDPATDRNGAAEAGPAADAARPARRTRAAKNERRRLGKRGGAR
ncbi:hypothetical protein ACQEU3_08205 [Spirillospora sp. CA-253888]